MDIKSRTIRVWDIHAFCVVCGDHIVLSMLNDPNTVSDLHKKLKAILPVCPDCAPLMGMDHYDDGDVQWQSLADYEDFLNAAH